MSFPLWAANVERFVHVASPDLAVAFTVRFQAALSTSKSELVEGGFTGLRPPLKRIPGIPAGSMMPASNGKAGYTAFPLESFGPAKALLTPAACSRVRQLSVFARLQVSCAGLKVQACGLKIMPSFKPSFSSQAFTMELTISLLSESVSFGLIPFIAAAKYAKPRLELPVRIAGSPETMPSK